MTATPPRADLRTLAAEAVKSRATDVIRDAEGDYTVVIQGTPHELADAVLAAVLPAISDMLLAQRDRLAGKDRWSGRRSGLEEAAGIVRRPAAAAPPAGPSAPVPAENAPVVPEATPDDAPLDGEALALAEHFRHLDCGQVVDPVDLEDCGNMAEEVLRFLTARGWRARAVPEEADGQQAGQGDALTYAEMESERDRIAGELYEAQMMIERLTVDDDARDGMRRTWLELEHWRTVIVPELMEQRDRLGTDRDRLAAQVAEYRRVVEAAKAWRSQFTEPDLVRWPRRAALIAAVDALREAEPHQHECACNRNWGGPCGPCVCEEPPRQGVWRLTCGAENIPPNQTYATKGAAEDVMRLHDGACPGTHGVEFVPDAGTDQTEDDDADLR